VPSRQHGVIGFVPFSHLFEVDLAGLVENKKSVDGKLP
jgi:hypothetical protein